MNSLSAAKVCLGLALLCMTTLASGHETPIAEIRIDSGDTTVEVELDVVDLDYVLGIRDGSRAELRVADVRRASPDIQRYILDRIEIEGCALAASNASPGVRDGFSPRVVADFSMQCATATGNRVVSSRLFAELPGYRTVVAVSSLDGVQSYPMNSGKTSVAMMTPNRASAFLLFLKEGYRHIFAGYDHLLFLMLLVLPIARSVSLRDSVVRVAGIVSAFTVAHSVTLALSSYGYLSLPAAIVEPVIAGSIVIAAILNLVSKADRMLWPIAYLFGLIHGFGFAGAFAELAAGSPLRWTDLLGFNLGVEIGQLAVTIVALLLLSLVSRTGYVGRLLVPAGSLIVGVIGAAWFAERVL